MSEGWVARPGLVPRKACGTKPMCDCIECGACGLPLKLSVPLRVP